MIVLWLLSVYCNCFHFTVNASSLLWLLSVYCDCFPFTAIALCLLWLLPVYCDCFVFTVIASHLLRLLSVYCDCFPFTAIALCLLWLLVLYVGWQLLLNFLGLGSWRKIQTPVPVVRKINPMTEFSLSVISLFSSCRHPLCHCQTVYLPTYLRSWICHPLVPFQSPPFIYSTDRGNFLHSSLPGSS